MSSSASRELEAVRLRAVALEERYRKTQQELSDNEQHLSLLRAELVVARDRIETLQQDPDAGRIARLEQELEASQVAARTLVDHLKAELEETRTKFAATLRSTTTPLEARIGELEVRTASDEQALLETRSRAARAEADLELATIESIKVPQLEAKLADHEILSKLADQEYAAARAQLVELQARLQDPSLASARERAEALGTEVSKLTEQLAAEHARVADLERRVAGTRDASEVDSAIADAAAARRTAAEHAETLRAAERRAVLAEQRMTVAETVSQTMSKDVTEMLRRVRDLETRLRAVTRERDEASQRLVQAEAASAEHPTVIAELERRAVEAEDRAAELERAFGGDLEGLKTQLGAKLAEVEGELGAKLAGVERELGGKLANAERELAAERTTAARLVTRRNELERELTALRKQLDETATTSASQRADLAELERVTREAATATEQLRESQADVAALERRVHALEEGLGVAESAALAAARAEIERVTRITSDQRAEIESLRAQLETRAISKRRADAVERDRKALEERLADAEKRARIAEGAERDRKAAEARLADVEKRTRLAERDVTTLRSQLAAAAQREAAADARGQVAERSIVELRRKIVEGQERISMLEREVSNADSVRAFAADTEREIAQLRKELREAQTALSQFEQTRLARRDFTESETTVERGGPIRYRIPRDDD